MAVTRQSWAHSLLSALDLPTTLTNQSIIAGWEAAEGGAGPQFGVAGNTANFNPLNTTQAEPGSTSGNSVGVQSFISWQQGLQATIATLTNGHYASILNMLQSGTASPGVAAAVIDASVWGTKDLTAALITGASVSANGTGDPVASISGGGVFGLGGTGTSANAPAASLWIVGDSSNPDQDYWTTINQYGSDAQWYVASDGETLFIADGIQIMGQTPVAVIVRTDPSVLSADLSYDNSSWTYTSTHVKKAAIQRRAALAKVTAPTEVEIKVICDIDAFRALDVAYLKLFGPADGLWLVGETQRSVFQPYTTLTLVQAMQPINANSGLALGPAFTTGKEASRPGSGTVIAAMISEATTINNQNLPYQYGGGHTKVGTPDAGFPGGNHEGSGAGFDCSGAVAAVLAAGGLWQEGSSVGADTDIISTLRGKGTILPGAGSGSPSCTLYDNPGVHIFLSLNGTIFGTSDGGGTPTSGGGGGGAWLNNGPDTTTFNKYHIPASILGQSATAATG